MRRLSAVAAGLAAVNLALLVLFTEYDVRLGPLHLAAHEWFKPLLYLNAAVLLAAVLTPVQLDGARWTPPAWLIASAAVFLYLPSMLVNFDHPDWTHRVVTSQIRSLGDVAGLFVHAREDGFYRPLTFLSLWLDERFFGDRLWGYHLQNIALHAVNGVLVAHIAQGLGLGRAIAGFGALLFVTAPVNYEPVMWPGARFDLLAAFFTLLALRALLRYAQRQGSMAWMTAWFAAGVLSKESAYCFPLLVIFFLATPRIWGLPERPLANHKRAVVALAAAAAVLMGIRLTIYGGLGGYAAPGQPSPEFTLQFKTLTSVFVRALPVPVFAIHTVAPLAVWVRGAILAFAVWCGAFAWGGNNLGSRKLPFALLVAFLITSLPAVNLVGWIAPDLHNTRYLYLPSIWILLLLAAGAASREGSRYMLSSLALLNGIAAVYNFEHYGKP